MRQLLTLTLLLSLGCDGVTTIRGRVLDSDGNPISEAFVKVTEQPVSPGLSSNAETTTDDRGHFSADITHAPSHSTALLLNVEKAGFVRYEEILSGSEVYERDVVLQPVK